MLDVFKKTRVFCLVVVTVCCADELLADFTETTSSVTGSNPAAFLAQPSFEIGPWFAAGITNNERSPEFVQRLRDASATGNAIAQGFLGLLLVKGDGMPPDVAHGMHLLRSSATQGCLPAMSELGYIYLEGHYGVSADPAEALKWIRPAAKRGWDNAQFNLGYCYERGLGIGVDFPQAAAWYRLAAQQTNLVALGSLGAFYIEGRGLPRDYAVAERLLRQAMEGGNIRAKLNLALYPALYRLEEQGWISSEWGTSENNRKAKFYKLTATGRKQLVEETSQWKRLSTAIDLILRTA